MISSVVGVSAFPLAGLTSGVRALDQVTLLQQNYNTPTVMLALPCVLY